MIGKQTAISELMAKLADLHGVTTIWQAAKYEPLDKGKTRCSGMLFVSKLTGDERLIVLKKGDTLWAEATAALYDPDVRGGHCMPSAAEYLVIKAIK